jgi:AraC-like DNA-binding protein
VAAAARRWARQLCRWLRPHAVARARQLLAGTELTVAQVAEQCGYDNLAHFGVLFRRFTGATPAAYRGQRQVTRSQNGEWSDP